jgi:hypothetical protein
MRMSKPSEATPHAPPGPAPGPNCCFSQLTGKYPLTVEAASFRVGVVGAFYDEIHDLLREPTDHTVIGLNARTAPEGSAKIDPARMNPAVLFEAAFAMLAGQQNAILRIAREIENLRAELH